MPIQYKEGIIEEHKYTRAHSGIFDVSHMGQLFINGTNDLTKELEKIFPTDLTNLSINKSKYSFLMNDNAGIHDDLIITKVESGFMIILNAACKVNDFKIIEKKLDKKFNLKIREDLSLVALQGPEAKNVLEKIIPQSNKLKFMHGNNFSFEGINIYITRSGYTGEDGFEISIPNDVSNQFIEILLENSLIKLCGLGARDSLRIEAGLSLYGNELNEKITPIEASLTWSLHKSRLNDESLNGSKILTNQLNGEIKNLKVGLKSISRTMLRSNTKIYNIDKNQIGYISSGTFSPILGSSIGIGYINKSEINNKIYILIRNNWEELNIVSLPFIQNRYKRGG